MPGDVNKVLTALGMAFATGFVSRVGGKAFDQITASLQQQAEDPPSQLQSVPSWSFIGKAFWGQDGFYYFHNGANWFVLHPNRITWVPIQTPVCQLFDEQNIYLGSNGITYLQNFQGVFAFSPNYGWIHVG
jgi:hypothetical protein